MGVTRRTLSRWFVLESLCVVLLRHQCWALLFSPDLIWYAGLSGALHGIFAWGACVDIKEKMKSGWLLLIGLAIKVGYEQIDGSSEQVANLIDAKVAVDAHLFGALTGITIFC